MLGLLLVAIASLDVSAVANPRASGSWVSDGAHMLGAEGTARLDERCERLHRDIGLEVAVVTVDAVGGDTRRFAVSLFNHWGIGSAETDNGLLIFLSRRERALETVTGSGLDDVLTDSWLKATQDRLAIPAFKRGDFAGGVEALLGEIERYLHEGAPAEGAATGAESLASRPPTSPATTRPAPHRSAAIDEPQGGGDDGDPWLAYGALAGLVGLGGAGVFGVRRYRKWERTCPGCRGAMALLDEAADDAYIDPGQRTEERIGSIDHRVFWCAACQKAVVRRPNRAWLSGWKRCSSCRYRTLRRDKTTTSQPTTTSTGTMRIDEHCENCGLSATYYRTLPRLSDSSSSSSSFGGSSSSSSSSSSSFGGGSSSGGGASSSW